MTVTFVGSQTGSAGAGSNVTITPPAGVQAGDLITFTAAVGSSTAGAVSMVSAGWTKAGEFGRGGSTFGQTLFKFLKVATGSEPASYSIDSSRSVSWEVRVYRPSAAFGDLSLAEFVNYSNSGSVSSYNYQAVTVTSEGGLVEIATGSGSDDTVGNFSPPVEFSNITEFSNVTVSHLSAHRDDFPVGDTGTIPVTVNELAGPSHCTLFVPYGAATPTFRKGSTFDIETTLGTITTATLNGVNVFDHVTGQVGTTVSFAGAATDEITTSGEYTLALGDGTGTENITVQVNVVGLPSNTLRKAGSLQINLTDIEFDAFNASDTLVEQLTGLTSDGSGVMSPVDLSSLSEAVGDNLTVSLYSASATTGITFVQALELI